MAFLQLQFSAWHYAKHPLRKPVALRDVIDMAKANPQKGKVADTGVLSGPHLNTLQLQKKAGVKFAPVHFDGALTAMTALMGGHVDVQAGYLGDFLSSIKSGQARALAVMDTEENPSLPGVKPLMHKATRLKGPPLEGLRFPPVPRKRW